MRVIFVRHGLAESNITSPNRLVGQPAELVDEGVEQIKAARSKLGRLVAADTARVIFASPLIRTRQTAEIIAEELSAKIVYDDRLREIYKGLLEGGPVQAAIEFEAGIAEERRHLDCALGGENWLHVGRRMAEFVEEKRNQGYQDVVIVSHDHPIRMGIGKLMNRPPITWEDMHLDNGSITILEHTDAQWRLVPEYVNWRPNMTAVRLRGFAEKLFNLLFRYNRSGERQSAD